MRFLLLNIIAVIRLTGSASADLVVAVINNEPVTAAEYRLVMDCKSPEVYSYFKAVRNLDDYSGYWFESTGPEGPLAKLRQLVLEELIRIKVCQSLARTKGLAGDISFAAFQESFEQENARRLAAKTAGQIVYGPTQYQLPIYYYIRFDNLLHQLIQELSGELEPQVSEEEIVALYREKEGEFKNLTWDESRTAIVRFLSRHKAEAQLEAIRESAVVVLEQRHLRELVPRVDPE